MYVGGLISVYNDRIWRVPNMTHWYARKYRLIKTDLLLNTELQGWGILGWPRSLLIRCYGKTWINLLANPIFSLNKIQW